MVGLLALVTASQRAVAGQADDYVAGVLAAQGIELNTAGRVNPLALSGVASDGRSLSGLLTAPAIITKRAISQGVTIDQALLTGGLSLDLILKTQIADAGRVADGIATAAQPRMGYVRVVSPPSCPRCAILAGRWYRFSSGFQRHPGCDCTHLPAPESGSGELVATPRQLLEEGQIRGLSQADTKAILDGADMNRVVNSRRGMSSAARPRTLRRAQREARLMPEAIYRQANGNRSEALRLLNANGFLI
jgi:hypothetical protein